MKPKYTFNFDELRTMIEMIALLEESELAKSNSKALAVLHKCKSAVAAQKVFLYFSRD